jgi:hypothetical protein
MLTIYYFNCQKIQQNIGNAVLKCRANGMELASLETSEKNMCAQRYVLEKGEQATWFYSLT